MSTSLSEREPSEREQSEREGSGHKLSRRKLIAAGLATAAGAAGLAVAARLAARYGLIPPDDAGVYGLGNTLTYAAQRPLMSSHSLAREFDRSQISKVAPVNGLPPTTDLYHRFLAGGFADWRLTVDGLVERPASFSLAELKRFPAVSEITHQACEEGWSFIAESTGVPLSYVLDLVGVSPRARYVMFFPMRSAKYKWGSLDMAEAHHPQTLLAYGMNGEALPSDHGAPLRVRVPRQLGFKSLKHLATITLVEDVKAYGKGLGSSSPENGFSWYGGI